MEPEVNQQELQAIWNEEAGKLEDGHQLDAQQVDAGLNGEEVQANEPEETNEIQEPQQQAQAEPEDPYAGLPDAVKAKLAEIDEIKTANAQLLHHVRTTEGRVAAMQREADQARRAAQAATDAPTQGAMAAAANNPEKWEQLKQDFPEWAGAMEEYVAAQLAGTQRSVGNDDVSAQLQQAEERMARKIEEARIEGKYEDWRDTINTQEFVNWFQKQTVETQALAQSQSARDAIRMLDMFETAKAKPVSGIKQERNSRLAAAATTRPGQTPPPKTLDDMSPEELWNYEAKKRDSTRAARGY